MKSTIYKGLLKYKKIYLTVILGRLRRGNLFYFFTFKFKTIFYELSNFSVFAFEIV